MPDPADGRGRPTCGGLDGEVTGFRVAKWLGNEYGQVSKPFPYVPLGFSSPVLMVFYICNSLIRSCCLVQ